MKRLAFILSLCLLLLARLDGQSSTSEWAVWARQRVRPNDALPPRRTSRLTPAELRRLHQHPRVRVERNIRRRTVRRDLEPLTRLRQLDFLDP